MSSAPDTTVKTLEDFPDDLILKVLSYLKPSDLSTKASLVNHRFHRLSMDPSLWTRLHLLPRHDLDHGQAIKLFNRCTMLKELTLEPANWNLVSFVVGSNNQHRDHLAVLALKLCPGLKTLSVPAMTVQVSKAISWYGSSLKNLQIRSASMPEAVLVDITRGSWDRLTSINLSCHPTDEIVKAIADHCSSLEQFNVSIKNLSEEGLDYFLEAAKDSVERLAFSSNVIGPRYKSVNNMLEIYKKKDENGSRVKLPRLKRLSIFFDDRLEMATFIIVFGRKRYARLATLELHRSRLIDDDILEEMSNLHLELTCLVLHCCSNVTDVGVRSIFGRSGDNLKSVHLSYLRGLTDGILADVSVLLPGLEKLQVHGCRGVGKDACEELMKRIPRLDLLL